MGVVASHLSTTFSQESSSACCASGTSSPSYRQLPPLRLLAAGHAWLGMFFILSAFIIGCRVMDLANQTSPDERTAHVYVDDSEARLLTAYRYLAISAFKRPLRLALPAAFATVCTWLVVQAGGFVPARQIGNLLLSLGAEQPRPWPAALKRLLRSILGTWQWLGPEIPYDNMQWSLVYMLQGSFLCSTVLLMTLHLKLTARILIITLIWYLGWDWSRRLVDPLVTPSYMMGLLLAHLRNARLPTVAPLLLVAGIVLMSFPKSNADQVPWTRRIKEVYSMYLPFTLDLERGVGFFGCTLVIFSILLSPALQGMVGHLSWLGRLSFGIYLTHMSILRLLLPWLAFAKDPVEVVKRLPSYTLDPDMIQKPISSFRLAIALAIVLVVVLLVGYVWSCTIDPLCERIISRFQRVCLQRSPSLDKKIKRA
jgi:hypothetical protein